MIGQMAVRVTADRANFPLGTLFVRRGSAANVALVGVPVRAGVDVESVTVRVENVDGEAADFAARQYGGVWVVDLLAAHFATVGSVTGGVTVYATGTGADGETARTWNIGVGDLEVLPADADAPAPTPGQAFWPLRMFDAAPTTPTKYNAYLDGTALKIWNGSAWVTISGGASTVAWADVTGKPNFATVATSGSYNDLTDKPTIPTVPTPVAPSTDPSAQGKPADAKATGDALAGKLALETEHYVVAELFETGGTGGGMGIAAKHNNTYEDYLFTNGLPASPNDVVRRKGLPSNLPAAQGGTATSLVTTGDKYNWNAKADAADLRYRIAEAGLAASLPTGVTVWLDSEEVTNYAIVSDVVSDRWELQVADNVACIWDPDGTNGDPYGAEFKDGGGAALSTPPDLVIFRALADRTVNLITASDGTSIDIELPALAHVGRMRDFYVRLTVSATSASTWTIGQGESWDAMGSPPSSFAAGTYLYHISEVAAGVWHAEDMFAVAGKMPKYPMVPVTPSGGTLTVSPYTVATYTADDSAAAFEVAVGTGDTGKARDCELVIDCTATGAVAPTVTWPATFHPRTDAATDFACEAGVRNVYYISEYATGEFVVGGWQETAGGNT